MIIQLWIFIRLLSLLSAAMWPCIKPVPVPIPISGPVPGWGCALQHGEVLWREVFSFLNSSVCVWSAVAGFSETTEHYKRHVPQWSSLQKLPVGSNWLPYFALGRKSCGSFVLFYLEVSEVDQSQYMYWCFSECLFPIRLLFKHTSVFFFFDPGFDALWTKVESLP